MMDAKAPHEMRDALLTAVRLDLLGPAGGTEEEVDEDRVRDRYLVGLLAPRRHEVAPEELDELAEGGAGTGEDGPTDFTAPQARTLFPSSIGMTFCVDVAAADIQVTARWGQYLREPSAFLVRESGEPKLIWKRHPREGSRTIVLEPGRIEPWVPVEDCPDVHVQGLVRKRDAHWSVSLFLVNGQEEPKRKRDETWVFQPEIVAESADGKPSFHRRPVRRSGRNTDPASHAEEEAMALLYRRHVEFAMGHGVSVHAEVSAGNPARAVRIATRVVPEHEVPRVTPPIDEEIPGLRGLVLDMKELAETPAAELPRKLEPLAAAYEAWIRRREEELRSPELSEHRTAGEAALGSCRSALERIRAGIRLLVEDAQAAEGFRFANRAMWLQRVRTIHALGRRRDAEAPLDGIDVPRNRSWYPFQLAFILLNLPGVTRLDHPDRAEGPGAICDLLWFPTGGGKTEAYLGLSAYTLALRRLQGTVAGRSGEHGVAVLMRYTLRLLTLQQFQRASALACAAEVIRREAREKGDARWGEEPFRIGLWVGQHTTPNTTDQSSEAVKLDHGQFRAGAFGSSGTPAQLTNCPWCGTEIKAGRDIKVETYEKGRARTLIFCGDELGRCPFSAAKAPGEGLPVLVVDEEIYRRLPAILIATVDKFAQMPWNGKVQMLFGRVDGRCERHGFRSPEVKDEDRHVKRAPLPAARTVPHPPVRPPDLIIQDELHLISGPLGTLVGLYETAVDALCAWEVGGKRVRPKVIASTATIRKAPDQIHSTFLRQVSVFPPHGLDIRDNFFSLQRQPSPENPGRVYLGICAPGRRLKAALIQVYIAFLAAAQQLYERHGIAVDPWMTLLGYFNSMRELGGARRVVFDDVKTRLGKMDRRGLAKRVLYLVEELTSRKSSADIPSILDAMERSFDPALDALRKERAKSKEGPPVPRPLDVLLSTNMVSVGVDVQRLGLMVVAGQPKTTAEYIQATSRVGRRFPGIVCTVYNWSRPRDMSHYEGFEHYHATFYRHVEPLSVTPFAPGALERGLTALLVSLVRLRGTELNANDRAGHIDRNHPHVKEAIEVITKRAHQVGRGARVRDLVEAELAERIDEWLAEAQKVAGGRVLGFEDRKDGITIALLQHPGVEPWDDFTCLNSLRDVEPEVGLILQDGGLDDEEPAERTTGAEGGTA